MAIASIMFHNFFFQNEATFLLVRKGQACYLNSRTLLSLVRELWWDCFFVEVWEDQWIIWQALCTCAHTEVIWSKREVRKLVQTSHRKGRLEVVILMLVTHAWPINTTHLLSMDDVAIRELAMCWYNHR